MRQRPVTNPYASPAEPAAVRAVESPRPGPWRYGDQVVICRNGRLHSRCALCGDEDVTVLVYHTVIEWTASSVHLWGPSFPLWFGCCQRCRTKRRWARAGLAAGLLAIALGGGLEIAGLHLPRGAPFVIGVALAAAGGGHLASSPVFRWRVAKIEGDWAYLVGLPVATLNDLPELPDR